MTIAKLQWICRLLLMIVSAVNEEILSRGGKPVCYDSEAHARS